MSENRNWFQEKIKLMMAEVAIPFRTRGSTINRKLCKREQPSIMAESSSSAGTLSKKAIMSQVTMGRVMIRCVSVRA